MDFLFSLRSGSCPEFTSVGVAGGCSCRPVSTRQAVRLLLVMTFLCFLGALPGALVVLFMGPLVLIKVYSVVLNTTKNTPEP